MPKTTYRTEEISIKTNDGSSAEHYNILDSENNKVATCYKKHNADLVVRSLNAQSEK